jgi:hypothetical protein
MSKNTVKALKLSPKQQSVYEGMLSKPHSRLYARPKSLTMRALARRGLVELVDSDGGWWQLTGMPGAVSQK